MDRGYELHVRFKQAKNQEDARKQETKLLKKYNYGAWNKTGNGERFRGVLRSDSRDS